MRTVFVILLCVMASMALGSSLIAESAQLADEVRREYMGSTLLLSMLALFVAPFTFPE